MRKAITDKTALIGAGVGLTLFAVYGLMPGAFVGGLVGLNVASALLLAPETVGLAARALVAVGMLTGVATAGLCFTVAGMAAGWLTGRTIDKTHAYTDMRHAHRAHHHRA